MMSNKAMVPIDVRPLFRPLDAKLIDLLQSLDGEDWQRQTVAKEWKVKDVASHLLDGSLRALSMQRDGYFGNTPPDIQGYQELVDWLNALNRDWVLATKRLSPEVLRFLLERTGPLVSDYYESLDPFLPAVFSVDWAGETQSFNWMHVAREYTEKWHHQQQIREATGKEGIMDSEYFYPVMDTFFRALPFHFRDVKAAQGTVVKVTIHPLEGGHWWLKRIDSGWQLVSEEHEPPTAWVTIPADIAWKLFSKSVRPGQVLDRAEVKGDRMLGEHVLKLVSVMA